MVPTLFFILLINFSIIHLAPGGPVAHQLERIQNDTSINASIIPPVKSAALSETLKAHLEVQYGFDKPAPERFVHMITSYARFDLGESLFRGQTVTALIAQKLPISLLLGALSLIVMYAIALPLGVYKALHDGALQDRLTTLLLSFFHAMPMFVFALVLLVLFAGGQYWRIFPLQGATSEHFATLSLLGKVKDLAWHLSLPVIASSVSGLASISYLSKFAFMEAYAKPYVTAALGFRVGRWRLYRRVFKNASLVLIGSLPAVVMVLVSGNLLIEIVFGIDGMGRLAYEALSMRDYPVVFGLMFVFSLLLLMAQLLADILYQLVNPRLDFADLGV